MSWAYFLDLDGTLLDLALTPDAVVVPDGLVDTLGRLHARCGGALAIVSGRALADIDRLMQPLILPAAGQHGLQRRDAAGTLDALRREPALNEIHAELSAFANDRPGVLVEDKGLSVTVHYRLAPDAETEAQKLASDLAAHWAASVALVPGKMIVELRQRGSDKGRAIRAFMQEAPFAGRRALFAGDDATDEHGFEAMADLGGIGIKMGPGPTRAAWRLSGPAALRAHLATLAGAGSPDPEALVCTDPVVTKELS